MVRVTSHPFLFLPQLSSKLSLMIREMLTGSFFRIQAFRLLRFALATAGLALLYRSNWPNERLNYLLCISLTPLMSGRLRDSLACTAIALIFFVLAWAMGNRFLYLIAVPPLLFAFFFIFVFPWLVLREDRKHLASSPRPPHLSNP